MRVKYLTNKGSGKINEDTYLITSNLYGVFDGATGLVKYTDKNGSTGGLIAAQIAKNVFEKNFNKPLLLSAEETLTEIWEEMNLVNMNLHDKAGFWSTTASVVRINDKSIEYLRIGDSPIIFLDKNDNLQVFFVDHDLDTMTLWEKLAKKGIKNIRNDENMQTQLLKNRRNTNITYGSFNGEKEAMQFVQCGSIPREKIKQILIFSDGMLIPKRSPSNHEDFSKIVNLVHEGGLGKTKDYIRNLEDSDPDCTKYLRFKQHDDLTAIAITL